jgi:hypothetical protein
MYRKKCVERFKQKILRNKNRERFLRLRQNGTRKFFRLFVRRKEKVSHVRRRG